MVGRTERPLAALAKKPLGISYGGALLHFLHLAGTLPPIRVSQGMKVAPSRRRRTRETEIGDEEPMIDPSFVRQIMVMTTLSDMTASPPSQPHVTRP